MRKINELISLLFLAAVCSSCAPTSGNVPKYGAPTGNFVGTTGDASRLLSANSILILPVMFDEKARAQSPNAPLYYDALVNAFRSDVDVDLKADERLLRDLNMAGIPQCGRPQIEAARRYDAEAVLCTTIHQFTEREGSALGAERPASLSFSMEMRRAEDGELIWGGDFVFRDAALNENLLRLPQLVSERSAAGGGWQSARSALVRGFREASQDFARKRLEKFAPGQF